MKIITIFRFENFNKKILIQFIFIENVNRKINRDFEEIFEIKLEIDAY